MKIRTPTAENTSFTRTLFRYLGPALMVSVAYMDPGNYGTDLQAGSAFKYELVWAVWLASGMAMVLQYLSGKLGIATGKSLPELIRLSIRSRAGITAYWLVSEVAIAATDLAEYLGTVFALNLLFGIPLLIASVFGALDVLIIMALSTRRFRLVEEFFMLFIGMIALGFLYQALATSPDLRQVATHSVTPSIPNSDAAFIVVGIVGATVMPHALFVHSWLTKNKIQTGLTSKRRTLRLHLTENVLLLTAAAAVNVAILVVAATALYPSANPTIQYSFLRLNQKFGYLVGYVFAVTLLASGITSSTTGTIAGQAVMEGLLGRQVNVWLRRLITRFVNVVPTTVVILLGLNPLSMLVYTQVVLSILLPLPMFPLVYYTMKRSVMGEFVNRKPVSALAVVSVAIITLFNVYLLASLL
jgi:manganese transport protein